MGIHDGHREKMRRRFLSGGLEHFADHEALELLLYYAIPRRDTNPIAHALMERYGSLSAVLAAPVDDLKKVEGVGESAAVLLKMIPQLTQKARLAETERVLNSSDRAGTFLLELLAGQTHEVVYVLCLDRKGKLITYKRLGEGGISSAGLDIRKLVECAILSSASAVILAHNHPSGIAVPSREDVQTTYRVEAALEAVEIVLADHIIVSEGDYTSMVQSGFFKPGSQRH